MPRRGVSATIGSRRRGARGFPRASGATPRRSRPRSGPGKVGVVRRSNSGGHAFLPWHEAVKVRHSSHVTIPAKHEHPRMRRKMSSIPSRVITSPRSLAALELRDDGAHPLLHGAPGPVLNGREQHGQIPTEARAVASSRAAWRHRRVVVVTAARCCGVSGCSSNSQRRTTTGSGSGTGTGTSRARRYWYTMTPGSGDQNRYTPPGAGTPPEVPGSAHRPEGHRDARPREEPEIHLRLRSSERLGGERLDLVQVQAREVGDVGHEGALPVVQSPRVGRAPQGSEVAEDDRERKRCWRSTLSFPGEPPCNCERSPCAPRCRCRTGSAARRAEPRDRGSTGEGPGAVAAAGLPPAGRGTSDRGDSSGCAAGRRRFPVLRRQSLPLPPLRVHASRRHLPSRSSQRR